MPNQKVPIVSALFDIFRIVSLKYDSVFLFFFVI